MRELLPQMMSAQAAAAGLSDDAFERIDPLVEELFTLDATVGTAAAGFDQDNEEARRRIAATRTPAGENAASLRPFDVSIPEPVAAS
jgi:hypothetical protein